VFNLVLVWNKGISFGMFTQHGDYGPYILSALSLAIAGFFLIWLLRTTNRRLALSIGLVIGGAIGNVIDRLRFGAVVDFLDFHWKDWHYPAFNVADSAIVIGIAFIVLDGLLWEPKRRNGTKDDETD
ncbi:MAG: signal peptidase II, partial [Alphaproteobacteria bacterium]|nr:signal peptidase II [Alphaproteobacteria bacterium]